MVGKRGLAKRIHYNSTTVKLHTCIHKIISYDDCSIRVYYHGTYVFSKHLAKLTMPLIYNIMLKIYVSGSVPNLKQ